jgi:ferredoxin
MKGAIFYHSNTGNTQLVCRSLARRLQGASFDLIDIAGKPPADIGAYDVVGFATWTYYLGLPPLFRQFLQNMPVQAKKPAFLLTTYGMMPGQALLQMDKLLTAKGWQVLGGHSLWVPESYPPYIVKGWASLEAPTPKELGEFENFTNRLNQQILALGNRQTPQRIPLKIGLLNRLIPPSAPQKARKEMGRLQVDASLCDGCGLCQAACQYQAIEMSATPTFQPDRCQACWACFNHCPRQAIFTEKIRGAGQYTQPAPELARKLAVG